MSRLKMLFDSVAQVFPKINDKKNDTKNEMMSILIYSIVLILVAILLNVFVIEKVYVKGSSMENTLHDKEHLMIEKVSYHFSKPSRYDIVVLIPPNQQENELYIKRIIGLPGETIQIKEGEIYINGELLEESYGKASIDDPGIAQNEIVLQEGQYFVMGDNRNGSDDSRESWIGPIPRENIIGRAVFRLWPLKKLGFID